MLSRPVPAGAGDEYWRDQGLRLQCAKVLHVYPYSDGPRSAHAPGNTPTERFAERVEQEYFER